jgi:hypothetical protein
MEDSVRNIRNILAQGRQQLKQVMASLQNNARINGANEEFTDCLREYQELGTAFHTDMSFKDFCTIKHPEWYEPLLRYTMTVRMRRCMRMQPQMPI